MNIVVDIKFSMTWLAQFQRWLEMYSIYITDTHHSSRQKIIMIKTYGYLDYLDYMFGVSRVLFVQYEIMQPGLTIQMDELQKAIVFVLRYKQSHYWLMTCTQFRRSIQPIILIHAIKCRHVIQDVLADRLNGDISREILEYYL